MILIKHNDGNTTIALIHKFTIEQPHFLSNKYQWSQYKALNYWMSVSSNHLDDGNKFMYTMHAIVVSHSCVGAIFITFVVKIFTHKIINV